MIKVKDDVDKRDMILFGEKFDKEKYGGGIRHFKGLNIDNAKELVLLGFLDPHGSQNWSPNAEEFMDFMEEHPQYTAHGYAVSPVRCDCRVTIEGIEAAFGYSSYEELIEFVEKFRFADELEIKDGYVYAWWD